MTLQRRVTDLVRTYRYFDGEPLFPFGYGLSYSQLLFDNLQISPGRIQPGDQVTLRCDVTNTSDRTGDEVVQLYIRYPQATVPSPIQELKGFAQITLEPRVTKTVTFVLHTGLLAIYDEAMRQVVRPGTVDVMIGSASDCLPLTGQFTITGHPAKVGRNKIFFGNVQLK